jgi:hypothetical protein
VLLRTFAKFLERCPNVLLDNGVQPGLPLGRNECVSGF